MVYCHQLALFFYKTKIKRVLIIFSFIDYFILKNAQVFALYLLIVMHSSQKRSTFAALNHLNNDSMEMNKVFKDGLWSKEINVSDFVYTNITGQRNNLRDFIFKHII